MAGIASGICTLAVGSCDARRRSRQVECTPNSNTNTSTSTNSSNNTCAPSSEELAHYSNCGKQDIKGLTNQTGYVKGNANGVINFGTLTASAGAPRQA